MSNKDREVISKIIGVEIKDEERFNSSMPTPRYTATVKLRTQFGYITVEDMPVENTNSDQAKGKALRALIDAEGFLEKNLDVITRIKAEFKDNIGTEDKADIRLTQI